MTQTAFNVYQIGDRVRVGTFDENGVPTPFRSLAGTPTTPDTVTCKVRNPAGTVTTPTATADSVAGTGNYYADIDVDQAGTWYYRFAGTGAVVAADERFFRVNASEF